MNYLEMGKRALSAHEHVTQSMHDKDDQNDQRGSVPIPDESGHEHLESLLKGQVVELWSDCQGELFWLVADEEDAVQLNKSRGSIYTAAEARLVVRLADPGVVAEVHRWKRRFNGTIRECQIRRDR